MLAAKIVEAVRSVIGDAPAALHEPLMIGNEQKYVAAAIASGWVSHGEYIERFEHELAEFLGAKHVIATCNATCALRVMYDLLYEKEDLVMMPALTFVATANALIHMGAEPFFTDYGDGTKIAVPIIGHPVNAPYGFQDASQALGSKIHGRHVGSFDTAVFSFNGNKIITTGGGGTIVSDDEDLASHARHLIAQARVPHAWEIDHNEVGFNYRMPNMNAALGCAQLEALPMILHAKRKLAQEYMAAFSAIDGVDFWGEPEGAESNYWLCSIILHDEANQLPVLESLHAAGYKARLLPKPLNELPMYKYCESTPLPKTQGLYRSVICLPSSPILGMKYA